MFEGIMEYVHYGTILVYGIYLSAAFLGVRMNRRNVLILLGVAAFCGALNICSYAFLDVRTTEQIYPLIVHLPLVLFLMFFYKFRVIPSLILVVTVYLSCQVGNWIGLLALYLTDGG